MRRMSNLPWGAGHRGAGEGERERWQECTRIPLGVLALVFFGAYALLFSLAPVARLYRRATRIVEAAVAVVFAAFGVRLLLSPLRV